MRRTVIPLSSPLVIATHNPGKVTEIESLLGSHGIGCVSAASLGLGDPEETEVTFEGNARLKSQAAAAASGRWALADDSGLCVDGLDGAPGVYTARWAGENRDWAFGMQKIAEALSEKGIAPEGARAHFICVLSLTSPEGKTRTFTGRVDGRLTFPPRGDKGFGYDPIFIPDGHGVTFAEMEPDAKHAISHRSHAFRQFLACLDGCTVSLPPLPDPPPEGGRDHGGTPSPFREREWERGR